LAVRLPSRVFANRNTLRSPILNQQHNRLAKMDWKQAQQKAALAARWAVTMAKVRADWRESEKYQARAIQIVLALVKRNLQTRYSLTR
jgi:hypothetical protein